MTTLSSYLSIARDAARWKTLAAKSPEVALQTKYFQANIGKVKTADDLVGNARLFTYAMSAFGLGDRAYAKGLMKRVLQQGVSSPSALAYKLNDPNILAFAKAFDFAKNGAQTTQSASLVQSTVDQYTQNALEKGQAQQNPGVGLAVYFQRKAPAITSAYGLLADKKMLQVAQTALDISPMTAVMPIDQQASILGKKIKFVDFKDATKLQAFISRFAAQYDYKYGSASPGATTTNAVSLDASQDGATAMSNGLLQAMQAYRTY
jgi:hypothetical protein